MPVEITDMKLFLSGGSANTDPNESFGNEISTTEVVYMTPMNNLFDNVSADEASSGEIEYRCVYLVNDHATDAIDEVKIWIETQTPSADTSVSIGLDPAGIGDGSATGVAATPADAYEAPSGVSFSEPATEGGALAIGELLAGEGQAVWIRRTVDMGAASAPGDLFTLRVAGLPL